MPTPSITCGAAAAAQATQALTRVPLTLSGAGDRVTGVACVQRITTKTSRSGASTYVDIDVGHAEGRTTLRVWSNELAPWAGITEGAAVALTLESKKGWRPGTFEWALREVALLPEDHPVRDDLLPQCPVPPAELNARWDAVVARLTPARRVLLDVVLDHVGRQAYDRMAAAERMHHATVGGLKQHSLELAAFALAMADAVPEYAGLSTDAIILGCLLHDIGKVRETEVLRGIGIRRATLGWGRYHTTIGPEMVGVACALQAERLAEAGVTSADIEHLKHVCECHHGDNREHGSPTPPRSREAWLIHAADLASARLRQLTDDMAGLTPDADGWCRSGDGRRTPVFVPGAECVSPTRHEEAMAASLPVPAPPMPADMLHLVLFRDGPAAASLSLIPEDA